MSDPFLPIESPSKKIQYLVCIRCNHYKPIKAKSLCNSCYTHENRQKAKESSKEEEIIQKLKQELEETKKELVREREKNSTTNTLEFSDVHSSSSLQSNLALAYVQEKTVEPLAYGAEKYRAHLEECKRKSKWSGWKEDKLVLHFPCLSLFVSQYKEDVLSKRNQEERQLLENGKVEFKSLIQTKGRIITITGQFFGLMEAILSSNESFKIEDLFSLKRIRAGVSEVLGGFVSRTMYHPKHHSYSQMSPQEIL
jgi:ribosomal protein L40E